MSQQINVNIRMDRDIKESADSLFRDLGFNLTTAVNTFVRQCLREQGIPFQITLRDNYFDEINMKRLMESKHQMECGQVVVKTMEELEEMAK
ncbi:MAG: type II toxin-antitoxin system RelB/DinJ family antitoxin [Defluviitaleaceae bacterium]|nr:type II toxin-antitoxin system RelB/DinJ family antitoxin [Defluviitaleaceae bacterium]